MSLDNKIQNETQPFIKPDAPIEATAPIQSQEGYISRLKNYIGKGGTALRHRNYRLFFVGQGISLVGTRVSMVALPFFVLTTTGSPEKTGLVAVAEMLPLVVLKVLVPLKPPRK